MSVEAKLAWETEPVNLKLFDTKQIAKAVLYSKQRPFDFRDKPGKSLARVVANKTLISRLPMIHQSDGTLTDNIKENLDIFVAF